MINPISTYRIQFHHGFTFADLERIIPYLKNLGIQTVYASPVLEAVPGSTHGYDTVNPQRISPEIGTLEELKAVAKKLRDAGIQWIQDIVPNHMAFHQKNIWLMDVLEKGPESDYASFFDINWSTAEEIPLMVPFLGSTLEEAVEKAELQLVNRNKKIFLKYQETEWPVNARVKSIDTPLKEAIDKQYYRPCHWEETNSRINFRRFFTVNGLICLNIQHQETFTAYHQLIKNLLDEDVFQGLRVDHIDGLYDPETYLERLRLLAPEGAYIIVEKILEAAEELPVTWPVEGTTGYDFLAAVNNLFTYKKAKKEFNRYFKELTRNKKTVEDQVTEKKSAILNDYMAGELNNLYELFLSLNLVPQKEIDALDKGSLKEAIGLFLIYCPVYRFYGNKLPLDGVNYTGLKQLIKRLYKIKHLHAAVKLIDRALLKNPKAGNAAYNDRAKEFYLRCMQFSGPLMAKGVEDTLMYTYSRFIAHNEVGDSPAAFGKSKKVIHNEMWKRQKDWPLSMNGSSTHDTKRGEDVRARLNVLPALSSEWIEKVKEWRVLNLDLSFNLNTDDEYFIYQSLLGSYPMPGIPEDNYEERFCAYLEKALREGKRNSSWSSPDESYEQQVRNFAVTLLDQSYKFWESFSVFHRKTAGFGILNSLGQLLLKFTCPGLPDVYQGTELWDLSLVDPDNRRPVDYKLREEWLKEVLAEKSTISQLWDDRYQGKIKLLLLHKLSNIRNSVPDFFVNAAYIPLEVKGKFAAHIFAFARREEGHWLITVIPLHLAVLINDAEEVFKIDWKNTRIILPSASLINWENLLTDENGLAEEGSIPVAALFNDFPLALLKMEQVENNRSAGILLHITSLPSSYGIGDLGAEAKAFAGFLARSGQQYWQLLPLNPVGAHQGFSPYSSVSGMAGNILLISPELLLEDDLVSAAEVEECRLHTNHKVLFEQVAELKSVLLNKAYDRFKLLQNELMKEQFASFCEKEKDWLDDFALFIALKEFHLGVAWYDWEDGYKNRNPSSIANFTAENPEKLAEIKWYQFIFFKQWTSLKAYVNKAGIRFYGDLPFYVSHDSADVWARKELFKLDQQGKISGIAGVPPDYFNEDGQLWGMPVYRWDKLKKDGYQWWLKRIRRNMELYDLLRIDHFRAFCDYWEVAAGETTAIKGAWKTGPGSDFFTHLKAEFPDMPFVAEDLGEISEEVYLLRDEFGLMGMKVLQFAFGEDTGTSEHIPYRYSSDNFVVYTGTHDNDTSVGWYDKEAGRAERQNLNQYTNQSVTRKNINKVLIRLAYSSVAKLVILPMQDVLNLDGNSRMNKPASVKENWAWRLKKQPGKGTAKKLKELVNIYGRHNF